MSKFLSICLILVMLPAVLFANATAENNTTVNLAVMQGPTGFSSVGLKENVNVKVFASPDEAVAKLVNKELDMAVLPANTALNLYNKGVSLQLLAIVGEGMLSVIGTDAQSKEIAVPGPGGTPDHMQKLLYSDKEASYSVTAPAQLAQMLIANKIGLAILPQPFVNMVLTQNKDCRIVSDVQLEWEKLTGFKQYPMSVLVVREDFAKDNKAVVNDMKKAYAQSIDWVVSNATEAGQKIEELEIMKASLATGSIDKCALKYKDGKEAKAELEAYYSVLAGLAPEAIGGKLPDKDFWY